jgi:hypothetical protein
LAKSTTKLKGQQQEQEALGLEIVELESELATLEQQNSGIDGIPIPSQSYQILTIMIRLYITTREGSSGLGD